MDFRKGVGAWQDLPGAAPAPGINHGDADADRQGCLFQVIRKDPEDRPGDGPDDIGDRTEIPRLLQTGLRSTRSGGGTGVSASGHEQRYADQETEVLFHGKNYSTCYAGKRILPGKKEGQEACSRPS